MANKKDENEKSDYELLADAIMNPANALPKPPLTEARIVAILTEKKGNVVAIARLPLDKDSFLRVVCVEIRPQEYAVWTMNTEVMEKYSDCGCSNGDYFTYGPVNHRLVDALKRFTERLEAHCTGIE